MDDNYSENVHDPDPEGLEPYLPPLVPPHSNDGIAEGFLTPPNDNGFYAVLGIRPDETGTFQSGARYSWFEVFPAEASYGDVTAFEYNEGGRWGELTAVEVNLALDVAEGTVVWMRRSESHGGEGYAFLAPVEPGGGSGGGSGGGTDCSVTQYETDCISGVLFKRSRLLSTVRGCLQAGAWSDWEQDGYCTGDDPDPTPGPPCLALSYRYQCVVDPYDSTSRLAEYVSRHYLKDGCLTQTSWELVRILPICCDCPGDPGTGPPACDPVDGVDTECCDGVPCDLCLYLYLDRYIGCGDVLVDLAYDAAGYDDGTGTLHPVWRATGAVFGSCAIDVDLVCFKAAAGVPAHWELSIIFNGTTQAIFFAETVSCAPILLTGGFAMLAGNPCCPNDTTVDFVIRPGPCPGGSGSGSGPGGAGCCDPAPPATLYATFTGSLSAVGTVTLTYDAVDGQWEGSYAACGGGTVAFSCIPAAGMYQFIISGGPGLQAYATSCDPFLWEISSVTAAGSCAGAYTVTITE